MNLRAPHSIRLAAVLLPLCVLLLLWLPRPTRPNRPPALQLQEQAVRAQLALDAERARTAPMDDDVEELQALFLESGQQEVAPYQQAFDLKQRMHRSYKLLQRITEAHGPEAIQALRAAATEALEPVLRGEVTGDARDALLGNFPNVLARHNATIDGHPVAPRFVIRTLYKARWNTLSGLPNSAGFSAIEGQAYFGWLALHADDVPLSMRLQAIPEFELAGGAHVDEAAGVLLYQAGHYSEARDAFERAHDKAPSLRVRNYIEATEFAR